MRPKVSFVGAGVTPEKDVTLGARKRISQSSLVLYFPFLNSKKILGSFGAKNIEDISPCYIDGAVDVDNYKRMEDKILISAKKHGDVTFLTPGHPWLGVTLTQTFSQLAKKKIIDFEVIPGISSLDAMMVDLEFNPIELGCQILDVNRMLKYNIKLNPNMDCFLFSICRVAKRTTDYNDPSANTNINYVTKWLMKSYHPNTQVIIIRSNKIPGELPVTKKIRLIDLTKNVKNITFESTLFIKASAPKKISKTFLKLLNASK